MFGNDTKIGLSTFGEYAIVLIALSVTIWRLSAGDTPEDANVYVSAIVAVVVQQLSSWRRKNSVPK